MQTALTTKYPNPFRINSMLLVGAIAAMASSYARAGGDYTLSANVGVATDYVFRGISQTAHNPALQGGVDYAHSSGLYAGIWGSNVSWIADSGAVASGRVNVEVDTYFGFRNNLTEVVTYDIGLIRYNYPGGYTPAAGFAKADTDEIYGSIGYNWVSIKYSHGLGQFLTVPAAGGTNYLEVNASVPLADTGLTLGLHAGNQQYKGAIAAGFVNTPNYTDYKVGLTKELAGNVIGLAYTDTNASSFYTFPRGGDWAKAIWVLSVTHSF